MRRESQVFKALSDETRLRIMCLLQQGSLCVCEIETALRLPQYKVSKHLMMLRFAGLVDFERHGARIHYFLRKEDPSLAPLFDFLKGFLRSGESCGRKEASMLPRNRIAPQRRRP